jgi:predicted nuclease with TOPRIM domain
MDGAPGIDIRDKMSHWVQEGIRILPHLPALLHHEDATEADRLRKQVAELRKELEDLRKEHERLRADRDEIGQALTRVMDSVQPINQIAQKLGVRRSPFEGGPKGPTPAAPPAPPAPAPGPGPRPA